MKFNDAKYFGIKLSPHRIKNDKGQLIVTGCEFARTGKQKYHTSELGIKDKDEFIYLDRPVKEVSDPKTVASFEGAPVTLDHPKDDVKVGVNWDKLAKGFATNVKYIADSETEGHLQADFIFTDADLIKRIENNEINELSAGYNCDVDEDTWVQSHIRGNHIAVVQQARAGHQARLLDKKYETVRTKIKTVKIGDKKVKVVDTYTYELEDSKGNKIKYTDCYGETASGKKKFLCTIKDEANPKNVILAKVDGKWTKWGGTNKDKLEEDSRYKGLVKKYGKENLKFVKNEKLDEELKKLNLKDWTEEGDMYNDIIDRELFASLKRLGNGKYVILIDLNPKDWIYASSDKEAKKKFRQWLANRNSKQVKDSKESDARVLKELEKLLPEFDKLDKKYAGLVEMQKKYWNNWDGYSRALRSGELSRAKLDRIQAQSVKANKEYLDLVKKWNKLCMQTRRRGREDWFPKGIATEIRLPEEIHFPGDHYNGRDAFKSLSYMLNEINKVLSKYPYGTGGSDWTEAKLEDSELFNISKADANKIRNWWKKVEAEAFDVDLETLYDDETLEDWFITMWDTLIELKNMKNKSQEIIDLIKEGKKLYNKYSISKFNYKVNDDNEEDMTVDDLIDDEVEAVEGYEKAMENSSNRAKAVYSHILTEELEHIDELKGIKNFNSEASMTKTKDSVNPIFERRQAIDDKLRSLFSDSCFEVEGFMNGNDSDEGSIYVVDYNPYKDKACKRQIREDEDVYSIEDLDTEDFLELASDYIETKITPMLERVEGFESLDVGITDWSGEEEYPIDFHIYCEGVTR